MTSDGLVIKAMCWQPKFTTNVCSQITHLVSSAHLIVSHFNAIFSAFSPKMV